MILKKTFRNLKKGLEDPAVVSNYAWFLGGTIMTTACYASGQKELGEFCTAASTALFSLNLIKQYRSGMKMLIE